MAPGGSPGVFFQSYPRDVIYAFGNCELDAGLFELRRGGQVVKLAPKAFDMLHYQVEHRDRVVSKAELLDRLWPGEHVTEAVLPSNVTAIRKAIQEPGAEARPIQTVHGRGYRFVASVAEQSPGREGGEPEERELFIGREAAMAALGDPLDDAMAGRGGIAMLVGEPGIGKTRTANALGAAARSRGFRVAEGRCWEGEDPLRTHCHSTRPKRPRQTNPRPGQAQAGQHVASGGEAPPDQQPGRA